MAAQLTRRGWRDRLAARSRPVSLPPSLLAGLVVAVLAVALTSVVVAMRDAQRQERDAQLRLANAQQLLALPPSANAELPAQLAWAKAALAAWQAQPVTSAPDPASDATAATLVRHAHAAGLEVRGLGHLDPGSSRVGSTTYQVQGITIAVSGTLPQMIAYLADLRGVAPALFPSVTAMSIDAAGIAQAQLAFRAYAPPTAASATPGAPR